MKHKILIADDSLTIQKVIKITLASEAFDLYECTSAANLNENLDKIKPNIVLLDFNLSEDKTGYDLSKEIKSKFPNTKVLMLFGTFDTIDEDLLDASGTNHKIVKPFDGTKFINLCRVMAEDFDIEKADSINDREIDFSTEVPVEDEIAMPEVIADEIEEEEEEDEWVMDSPHVDEEEIVEEVNDIQKTDNPLELNMKDWGIDVPGVIGSKSDHMEIPGVIEKAQEIVVEKQVAEKQVVEELEEDFILPISDDLAFPDDDDLAFPDQDDLSFPDEIQLESKKEAKKPALVPLESLDEPDEEVEVSEGGTDSPEALENLKALIEDEIEEEDLWGADEYEESEDDDPVQNIEEVIEERIEESIEIDDLPQVEPHSLREIKDEVEEESDFVGFEDDFADSISPDRPIPEDFPEDVMEDSFEPISEPVVAAVNHSFEVPADLEERLKEKLAPVIEDFVKEYCRENIEKIAWEVIPDLAENLIKKEIQKITEQILNS
jgi:CheY-like chemotaxis protein